MCLRDRVTYCYHDKAKQMLSGGSSSDYWMHEVFSYPEMNNLSPKRQDEALLKQGSHHVKRTQNYRVQGQDAIYYEME